MDKKIKIDVHAPHHTLNIDEFVIVRVEGALSPRVGDRLRASELEDLMKPKFGRNIIVVQTGVWGSPRKA